MCPYDQWKDICPYKQWESPRLLTVSISRRQYYIHFKILIPLNINHVEFEIKDRYTKLKESMSFFLSGIEGSL
jgi:hypothetical protein